MQGITLQAHSLCYCPCKFSLYLSNSLPSADLTLLSSIIVFKMSAVSQLQLITQRTFHYENNDLNV